MKAIVLITLLLLPGCCSIQGDNSSCNATQKTHGIGEEITNTSVPV